MFHVEQLKDFGFTVKEIKTLLDASGELNLKMMSKDNGCGTQIVPELFYFLPFHKLFI